MFNNISSFAHQFNQQNRNEMMNTFKDKLSQLNENEISKLMSQAKKFGMSDEVINQGLSIIQQIKNNI